MKKGFISSFKDLDIEQDVHCWKQVASCLAALETPPLFSFSCWQLSWIYLMSSPDFREHNNVLQNHVSSLLSPYWETISKIYAYLFHLLSVYNTSILLKYIHLFLPRIPRRNIKTKPRHTWTHTYIHTNTKVLSHTCSYTHSKNKSLTAENRIGSSETLGGSPPSVDITLGEATF